MAQATWNPFVKYMRWLHTRWPAGTVEKLPLVNDDGTCNVPGIYVVGDLTGIPLLKFSLNSGALAVKNIANDGKFKSAKEKGDDGRDADIIIIGAGCGGMAAAVEAEKQGLSYIVLEASQPFSTIVNFPAKKPIYTYPNDMDPAGDLKVSADVKEALVDELMEQVREAGIETRNARAQEITRKKGLLEVKLGDNESISGARVIVAIGRTGNFRKLGVPGEELDKVYNRLHDPKEFKGKNVLVVGGGDSAMEAAIALTQGGADVTLSYRKPEFSRAKPENIANVMRLAENPDDAEAMVEVPSSSQVTTSSGSFVVESHEGGKSGGKLTLMLPSNVTEIKEDEVSLKGDDGEKTIPNDVVFAMIGREPPLDFFRRSGIRISGETNAMGWTLFALFFIFCCWMYMWKGGYPGIENTTGAWPNNMPTVLSGWSGWFESQVNDRSTVIGTLAVSMKSRSFYYTLAYCLCVVGFGIDRVLRRKTPYIWVQTTVLALIQVIPLFLLPELVLPWMGYNGYFDSGFGAMAANNLFELYISQEAWAAQQWPEWGHPRAYWRAYGFILAWPLMIYNVFTKDPMMWWLAISILQTFILIPAMIFFWGKGAYCGWICSCGALAETMGDRHRHKMPHGPIWNRLNMTGQVILWIALVLLGLHIVAWTTGNPTVVGWLPHLVEGKNSEGSITWFHALTSYKWPIDVFLAGIIGVGLYFKYSGRVWCRFACPLAALMHVYARFSRFRIFADKKKCISCNVCTSVCHQGIDIMNFANKGLGMQDPECVRCSACVQSCPTGVLTFGRVGADGQPAHFDMLAASPVQMAESKNEK